MVLLKFVLTFMKYFNGLSLYRLITKIFRCWIWEVVISVFYPPTPKKVVFSLLFPNLLSKSDFKM